MTDSNGSNGLSLEDFVRLVEKGSQRMFNKSFDELCEILINTGYPMEEGVVSALAFVGAGVERDEIMAAAQQQALDPQNKD